MMKMMMKMNMKIKMKMMSRDVSNLVMKVMIVKELMTGDVSPVAMFLINHND